MARRARLTLWVSLNLQAQAVLFAGLYAALGEPVLGFSILVGGLLLGLTPVMLRRSLSMVAHYQASIILGILDLLASSTGASRAPALYWMAVVPLIAGMTGGRRHGWIWLGLCAANFAGVAALELSGVTFANVLDENEQTILALASVVGLASVLLILAMVCESVNDAATTALDRANAGMRRVLTHVAQGLLTVDARGRAAAERSAVLECWLGPPPADPDAPIWPWLFGGSSQLAALAALGWDEIFEDTMPLEVVLDQLPRRFDRGERTFGVEYRPILEVDGRPRDVLVVLTDLTAHVAAERAERLQREQALLFTRLATDRRGFHLFWDESLTQLRELREGAPSWARTLHTLKGNSACFGLESVAHVCDEIEAELADARRALAASDVARIDRAWGEATARIAAALARERESAVIRRRDLADLEHAIARRADHATLAAIVGLWSFERTADTFARFSEQAQHLAARLGKGGIDVEIADHDVRIDPQRWAPVVAAMCHAIRNAIDHGIESPDQRLAAGKRARALLRFESVVVGQHVALSIRDDGAGVDWESVRAEAAARGLPHGTQEELVAALFSEGFTTRRAATSVSGRGAGLSALVASAASIGGTVRLESERGRGTCVRIEVPLAGPRVSQPPLAWAS